MITGQSLQDQNTVFTSTSHSSHWRLIWQGFRRQRLGMIGLITLLVIVLAVIFLPIIAPNPYPIVNRNPLTANLPVGTVNPDDGHLFVLGSDRYGQDYLDLLLRGAQFTLLVAFVPTVLVLIIGFALGALAGYFGGWIDAVLMQITDFLLTLPLLPASLIGLGLLLYIAPFSEIEPEGLQTLVNLITIFTLFGWMGVCRMVRALVLSLRNENYIEAARALGASTPRILFRHLLPNTSTALLVAGTVAMSDFAVTEAVLAYFGAGVHDSHDLTLGSLGTVLAANLDMINFVTDLNPFKDIRGYLILFPIIFLLIIVVAVNFIGDALRDVLDPRTHT